LFLICLSGFNFCFTEMIFKLEAEESLYAILSYTHYLPLQLLWKIVPLLLELLLGLVKILQSIVYTEKKLHRYQTIRNMGLYTISSCYYRAINVLQKAGGNCISARGIRSSYSADTTRRNQAHWGHRQSRGGQVQLGLVVVGREGIRGGKGVTNTWVQINNLHAVINPPQSQRLTGPHILTPKTILVPYVTTQKSYLCHRSPSHWRIGLKRR